MNFNIFRQKFTEARKTNNILALISLSLLLLVLIQQIKITFQHERIVLVPPQLTDKATIAWKSSSQNYLNDFALYIVSQISSTVPANADYIAQSMEPYFDQEIWVSLKPQLLAIKNNINYSGINPISYFTPIGGVYYEPETDKIFVVGKLTSVAYRKGHMTQLGSVDATYEIKMYIDKGLPKISQYWAYTGEAKTLDWANKHPKESQQDKETRQKQILVIPQAINKEIMSLDQNGQNNLSISDEYIINEKTNNETDGTLP